MFEGSDPQIMGQLHEMVGLALAGEGDSFGPECDPPAQGEDAGMSQIHLCAGDWVRITGSRLSGQQFAVTSSAVEGGQHLHEAAVNLDSSDSRDSFVQATFDALGFPADLEAEIREALASALEQLAASAPAAPSPPPPADDAVPEFVVVDHHPDPQRNGMYRNTAQGPVQVANFAMRITEHVCLHRADGTVETTLRGTIACLGLTRGFGMSAAEFASNEKLKAVIFNAGPPGVDFKVKPELLRRAITGVSSAALRNVTEDAGWTQDGERFLLPGGHVGATGYQDHDSGSGIPDVVFAEDRSKCWIGMRRLAPEELSQVKHHVVEDLLNLHDRRVMRCLLSATALAPLLVAAPTRSRPLLWLKGTTGSGKTFAARMILNFFGDYDLSADYRIVPWNSTGNYLQKLGFMHKDCLYFVDDYKPEVTPQREAVKLLQNYADGTGRGRLGADSSMKAALPIRGLLISTGEDFPMHNASGLARAVIVHVPNLPKVLALARRCRDQSPLYRGLMADFIAHLIREGRKPAFATRVDHWFQFYYDAIAGRQNDARIAGNHALLAAAFEEFARYIGDLWPGHEAESREFAEVDLLQMVMATVGAAEQEQDSAIFIETLGSLIECDRVWVKGLNYLDSTKQRPDLRIGRVINPPTSLYHSRADDDLILEINIPTARQAVQKSLRDQGKPPLALADQALIQQLAAAGLLLTQENESIPADHRGVKTYQVRIDGARIRVIRIKYNALVQSEGMTGQSTQEGPSTPPQSPPQLAESPELF